ncbi:zinc finger MYM-type 1-like [Paramuricea clavata]|uniref:Zinc finger MYM-type 1-like n=1 Tax=Paramuricea clavata TaxID=317549 RepID=A0A6S7LTQ6_PARCT|nr:zinc finger MYM-type 1-like [Paramuricea clavata]
MAEVPSDLMNYSYDPSAPLPTGKESRDHVASKGDPAFIKVGFGNWKKSEVFSKHEKSDCHRHSSQAYRQWKYQKPVDHQISEEAAKQESYRQQLVRTNRSVIGKIFDVVRTVGKLNLPFRGRREDEQSMNKGVFKEFITHIAKSDIVLQNHLTTSPAFWMKFIRRVKEAKFYAIIADETLDMSQTEQLSLLVRFVWNGEVEERLLAMMSMNETIAEALFEAVTQKLQQHGIDVAHLRGQCYDGANNVAGVHTGLQARIKEVSPSALLTHCYAHILNLVIVDTMSKNKIARDFFGTLQNLYVFIQSCPKRHSAYVKN